MTTVNYRDMEFAGRPIYGFFRALGFKVSGIVIRIFDLFRWLPARVLRLADHFLGGFEPGPSGAGDSGGGLPALGWWCVELILLTLDCLGLSEGYETAADLLKFNSRPLTPSERDLARELFGDQIRYGRVRIDTRSWAGPRHWKFCYVSFFHINSWGEMTDSVLIHELVHIWQYQRLGAVYIPRALRAQHSEAGYNYGGVKGLRAAREAGKSLDDFNLEQQAEIVADYFRIRRGEKPRWGKADRLHLPLYAHFLIPFPTRGGAE